MAFCKLNDFAVIAGAITLPLVGRPTAEMRIDAPAGEGAPVAGDAVTVKFEDGTTYKMAVARAGDDNGLTRVLLVGGAGGLGKPIKPRFYGPIPTNVVMGDIITDAGETAGQLDLPGKLPMWTRTEGPAVTAIQALFLQLDGRSWRILADGTVWAGVEAWPAGPPVQVLEQRSAAGAYVLEAVPSLVPGVTLAELGQVVRVVHTIGPQLRAEAWIGDTP
jgi:hypothetical protein